MSGWIGVDLDGTLAEYKGWQGVEHIGDPIPAMVDRVKAWIDNGQEVRIFTARVYSDGSKDRDRDVYLATKYIHNWLIKHLGVPLPVTCTKDFGMIELWDDRAVRVVMNEGRPCCANAL